jgi:hypothetical protein
LNDQYDHRNDHHRPAVSLSDPGKWMGPPTNQTRHSANVDRLQRLLGVLGGVWRHCKEDGSGCARFSQGDGTARHDREQTYNRSANFGLTTFPAGSTTTKNCLIGPVPLDCSACSRALAISSLAIPESNKLPNEEWIIEIATAIAAMIMEKRIKAILYKWMRVTVPVGCMIKANPKA